MSSVWVDHEVVSHEVSSYDVIKNSRWRLVVVIVSCRPTMLGSFSGDTPVLVGEYSVFVILRVEDRKLYRCTKVLAHTCGTEFLSPAHYACAEVNFEENVLKRFLSVWEGL